MTPPLWQKVKRTKKPLEESERGEWKSWLKLNIQKTKIMASSPITSWQIDEETMKTVTYFFFFGSKIRWWLQPWNSNMLAPLKKSYDQPRQHIKKQRHYFSDKGLYSGSYGFSSSHVWMWELDHKEGWAPKNWCFQIAGEELLRVPWTTRKSVNHKGKQPWLIIGMTHAEAPILWPPNA